MDKWVKYGKYFISAGIAVTGVLWFQRPGDSRIHGEDKAALFERAMEMKVAAYLERDDEPDFILANEYYSNPSNSILGNIAYYDILTIAGITRAMVDGVTGGYDPKIFWTTNEITGATYEPAVMDGGINVDTAAPTNGVSIVTYTYTTNTCRDVLLTTQTRLFTNESKGVYSRHNPALGPSPVTLTNFPVSPLVFPYNTVNGIKDLQAYHFWPFARAYQYPWEQWSWRNNSRIVVRAQQSRNMRFPAAWINEDSLGVSITATNEGAGYCIGNLLGYESPGYDNFRSSVQFVVVTPPTNGSPVYASSFEADPYIREIRFNNGDDGSGSFHYPYGAFPTLRIIKDPDKFYLDITGAGSTKIGYYVYSNRVQSNMVTVIEASWPNYPSVYVAVHARPSLPIVYATNNYFNVSAFAFTNTVTATATTNALLPAYYGTSAHDTDDQRITTNKLYELREALTNLYRTVYISDSSALTATNCITQVYEHDDSFIVSTNMTGTAKPIGYYDFGDGSSYIAGFVSGATLSGATTNTSTVSTVDKEQLVYRAEKNGLWNYTYWDSDTSIDGYYRRYEYEYKGISPKYPSLYALTNGMVKAVRVYARYENSIIDAPGYPYPDYGYGTNITFEVGGKYWTMNTLSNAVSGAVINVPSDTIPDTIVAGTDRRYWSDPYEKDQVNKAVFTKIYEVSNPTNAIYFDIAKPTVTGVDFARKYAYVHTIGNDPDYYAEEYVWNYGLEYECRIKQVLIVVDWSFKHLGNGFMAVTNTPGWRQ